MKKPILTLAAVALVAAALLIWQPWKGAERDPRTLRYAFEVETTILDPSRVGDAYSSRVIDQVFEGLVALDEKNEIVPCLAESWSSEQNGKSWVFSLRDGVRFHRSPIFGERGARSLDARDVEFSFTRLLGPGSTVGYAIDNVLEGAAAFSKGDASAISGIRVLDTRQIAFDLLTPDPLFPRRLSSVILAIVPREADSLSDGKVFGKDVVVGTGPFTVATRTETAVELTRNEDYWNEVPGNVERVEIRVIKNDALRLAAAKNGDVDVSYVPSMLARTIAEIKDGSYVLKQGGRAAKLDVHRTLNSTFLGLNCERLDPAFRSAIARTIDRKALGKLFLPGSTIPSIGPVPLSIQGYTEPQGTSVTPDLPSARQSLEASGSRSRMPIEILVHEKEGSEQLGQLLQAQLKEAGIQSELSKLEYGTVIQRMVAGDYDACVMSFEYVYSTPAPIIEGLLNSKRIPAPNFWRYRSDEVDSALARFQQATTPAASNDLAAQIVELIQSGPPAVYLYQTLTPVLTSGRLVRVPVNGHSIPMLWMVTMN